MCDADLHRLSIINFKVVVKEVKIFFDFSIIYLINSRRFNELTQMKTASKFTVK